MQNNSLVSVVMPVYNAAPYLQKAVESILSQTYQNIELIIIDDGSTDDSMALIRNFKDKRIQRIEFNENKGIVEALNTGMQAAKGEFIARMDADDISLSNRIAQQVNYLQKNKNVGILGTQYQAINGKSRKLPLTHQEICWHLLNASPFVHPSVMFRSSFIKNLPVIYNKEFEFAEDLELWVRASAQTELANLPAQLIQYRFHNGTHQKNLQRVAQLNTIIKKIHISNLFPNMAETDIEKLAVYLNRHKYPTYSLDWFIRCFDFFQKILAQYTDEFVSKTLNQAVWFHLASAYTMYPQLKKIIKNYSWIQLNTKQKIWLQIKKFK